MQVEVVLMDLFVQIDLPPYTDYASLEQMLTLAIECVSLIAISHYIEHIFSVGRMLDSVKSREYLIHLGCLPISYTVVPGRSFSFYFSRVCFQCLPCLASCQRVL